MRPGETVAASSIENYGDSAFNYRSAGAIAEVLDFPNRVHCHRNSEIKGLRPKQRSQPMSAPMKTDWGTSKPVNIFPESGRRGARA
jgi:hypothetical protein